MFLGRMLSGLVEEWSKVVVEVVSRAVKDKIRWFGLHVGLVGVSGSPFVCSGVKVVSGCGRGCK